MPDPEATDRPLLVVAIDGPAGSGKSTVGKRVAAELGLEYLDTGAMYRGVTFAALRRGIDPADAEVVARLAKQVELDLHDGILVVDGVDATIEIRGPEVTRAVSLVAANAEVRMELVEGPLRHLQGLWTFMPVATNGCRIELTLEFEFSNPLKAALLEPLPESTATSMVQAFVKRAQKMPVDPPRG